MSGKRISSTNKVVRAPASTMARASRPLVADEEW
jgi:hypothetical protein